MKYLDLKGTARASFGVYNSQNDVDYFIESLKSIIKILK